MSGADQKGMPPAMPQGFSPADLQADALRRAAVEAATADKAAGILAGHFSTAIANAMSDSGRMALACGVSADLLDEAMQRALAAIAVGTWQERLRKLTGAPVSARAAAKAMAVQIAKPADKPARSSKPH